MLRPLPVDQWNYNTARHLISRAGFDAPPQEVARLEQLGMTKAVESLLQFQDHPRSLPIASEGITEEKRELIYKIKTSSPEDRERMKKEAQKEQAQELIDLQGWWLQQMVESPNSLQEKLALFWHGHFATSFEKVKSPHLLWLQNEIFRQKGIGHFQDLLTAVSLDPAMLIYLDGNENQTSHPNENFAREVMELFTLGEGHYSEKDVQEAARAFTGWRAKRLLGTAEFISKRFDNGSKTILGKTAKFTAQTALEEISSQPACAEWICGKLWNFFASTSNPNAVSSLAENFQKNKGEIRSILRELFSSEIFYSPAVTGHQIKSPIHWLISTVRLLERDLPPPLICVNLLNQLGQTPFRPPNVKGWDGGIAWITTSNLLNRYNDAALLAEGVNVFKASPPKPAMEMTENSQAAKQARLDRISGRLADHLNSVSLEKILTNDEMNEPSRFLNSIQKRFLLQPLKPKDQETLTNYLSSQSKIDRSSALHTIRLLMSTTTFQLT